MRGFALIVSFTAASMGSQVIAMTAPNVRVIAVGKIINVDEKNSMFDVVAADGGQTRVFTPKPALMVIRYDDDVYLEGTWDDLRKIGLSGRITSIAVDPNNPNVVYIGGSR